MAITDDGTLNGRVQALVTRRDLAPLFGDEPADAAARHPRRRRHRRSCASSISARARSCSSSSPAAASVEWLARFTHLVDAAILTRVAAIAGVDPALGVVVFRRIVRARQSR